MFNTLFIDMGSMKALLIAIGLLASTTSLRANSGDAVFSLPEGQTGTFHSCGYRWVAFKTESNISVYEWARLSIPTLIKLSDYQEMFKFIDQIEVTEGSNTFTRALFVQKDPKYKRLCVVASEQFGRNYGHLKSGGTQYTAVPYFLDENTIVKDPNSIIAYRDMDLDGDREMLWINRSTYRTAVYERMDEKGDIIRKEIAPWSTSFSSDGKFYSYVLLSSEDIPTPPIRDSGDPRFLIFEGDRYRIDDFHRDIGASTAFEEIPTMGKWRRAGQQTTSSKIPDQ